MFQKKNPSRVKSAGYLVTAVTENKKHGYFP